MTRLPCSLAARLVDAEDRSTGETRRGLVIGHGRRYMDDALAGEIDERGSRVWFSDPPRSATLTE